MKEVKTQQFSVGQKMTVIIKRIGINGEGIGYFDNTIVFIKGALPGERVVAQISKVFPKYLEAEMTTIERESPDRIQPLCPIYEECGGCQLQHLIYDKQLVMKRDMIRQAFQKHTKIPMDKLKVKHTVGMKNPWAYRNKSQFQVREVDGVIKAGLYQQESHHLIDIEECVVQQPHTTQITAFIKQQLQQLNVPIYDEEKNSGIVRTIVVREAKNTDEIQVVFITNSKKLPRKRELIENLRTAFPQIVSVMQNVNQEKTSLVFGEETFVLAGKETISETMTGISYDLSARAFFQLNPEQTEKLYRKVANVLELKGTETVVDAYCGVGTIGLSLAHAVKEVRGMDIVVDAIEDAQRNAARANITNVQYEAGKAEEIMPRWVKEGFKPDVVIVDPPRSGCDDALLDTLKQVRPQKIVYVSCNPSTLARDVQQLTHHYTIKEVTPYDMFPQTAHVESVTLLELK
ncbi:23S rRNA (uracil(1939)-C(5))-methyltransferase RlmD [Brochothrix campestris]|uniref:TrmA/RumA/YfjO family RNA methyltransferase n=1 Tax=Brochothrix campestris FSL F6-1037 TaxID=1265861 RepID=W7CX66_9LIST|nr:23S rRNA (uracil(1939)-C(5))-methyltransferase RlmD [Brochothrix campestris]EUJ40356.1 TrmA/RumA/YfjO family RNA methyltransferase [Brochothrix campestris FSL F6-1037]